MWVRSHEPRFGDPSLSLAVNGWAWISSQLWTTSRGMSQWISCEAVHIPSMTGCWRRESSAIACPTISYLYPLIYTLCWEYRIRTTGGIVAGQVPRLRLKTYQYAWGWRRVGGNTTKDDTPTKLRVPYQLGRTDVTCNSESESVEAFQVILVWLEVNNSQSKELASRKAEHKRGNYINLCK